MLNKKLRKRGRSSIRIQIKPSRLKMMLSLNTMPKTINTLKREPLLRLLRLKNFKKRRLQKQKESGS